MSKNTPELRNLGVRLMDAYLDGMISADDYAQRKAQLLADRSRITEEIENLESGDRSDETRVREKVELIRALSLSVIPANRDIRLELLQSTTSNLAFDQNRLVVSWVSPFGVIAEREEITYGALKWDSPRTCRVECAGEVMSTHLIVHLDNSSLDVWCEKILESMFR